MARSRKKEEINFPLKQNTFSITREMKGFNYLIYYLIRQNDCSALSRFLSWNCMTKILGEKIFAFGVSESKEKKFFLRYNISINVSWLSFNSQGWQIMHFDFRWVNIWWKMDGEVIKNTSYLIVTSMAARVREAEIIKETDKNFLLL